MKDRYLRLIFIPLLGIVIPFFSGIISYNQYSFLELIPINLFFILLSFCIWYGSGWIHRRIRFLFKNFPNPILKVLIISLIGGLYGAALSGIFAIAWYNISSEVFSLVAILKFVLFSSLAVLLFTLVYEIIFLGKQRIEYSKIVDQLDWEKSRAEMSVLNNELAPHFIFNSLNTLSYLILNDPATAHEFNNKLASVYKYFLINKDRELITLRGEMEFIENYLFVLRVRYDDKIRLETELVDVAECRMMILPCALQVLVENAVKHNEFTESDPLKINVSLNGEYILVKNKKQPKPYSVNSTGTGLRNLSSRYKHVCDKEILIEISENEFCVKLPIIKSKI